jgi:signal transduction histidine kinase
MPPPACRDELPVRVDRELLIHSILGNLLINAAKYSSQDTQPLIRVFKEQHNAVIEIENTGPYIDEQQIQTLLSTAPVSPQAGTAGERGHGFGLTLVYHFYRLQGGRVVIRSEKKNGNELATTTVTLQLPLSMENSDA